MKQINRFALLLVAVSVLLLFGSASAEGPDQNDDGPVIIATDAPDRLQLGPLGAIIEDGSPVGQIDIILKQPWFPKDWTPFAGAHVPFTVVDGSSPQWRAQLAEFLAGNTDIAVINDIPVVLPWSACDNENDCKGTLKHVCEFVLNAGPFVEAELEFDAETGTCQAPCEDGTMTYAVCPEADGGPVQGIISDGEAPVHR